MADNSRSRERERQKAQEHAAAPEGSQHMAPRGRDAQPPRSTSGTASARTPATPAPPAATQQPDMHVLLAAISGLRNDVNHRFDGVENRLVDHGQAIHQALDAVGALQNTQSALQESIEDLRDSRHEQNKRIEALEAHIKERTTPSPPPGQADAHAELVESLAERLRRLESERSENRRGNTPSGPTTPETGSFAPAPPGGPPDPFAYSSNTLRAVASTTVPREAMRTAIEAFVAEAGLPRDCYSIRGPSISMYHTIKFEGTESAAAGNAKALLDSIKMGGGRYRRETIPAPDGSDIQVSIFPDRSLADRARRAETHSAADIFFDMGLQDAVAAPRDGLISYRWAVLANIRYDTTERRAITNIAPEEVRKAGLDPDELQRRLDTRPCRRPGQGQPKRGARPPPQRFATPPSAAPHPTTQAPCAAQHDGFTHPHNIFAPTAASDPGATPVGPRTHIPIAPPRGASHADIDMAEEDAPRQQG